MNKTNNLIFALEQNYDTNTLERRNELPFDYFNWGRDPRHAMDNNEILGSMPEVKNLIKRHVKRLFNFFQERFMARSFYKNQIKKFNDFDETYQLMSDEDSKRLFSQLLSMKVLGEKSYRIDSFDKDFVRSYENASKEILNSSEKLKVYKWELRKVFIEQLGIKIFTGPDMLNLVFRNRLYSYHQDNVSIDMVEGDVVIDCGVGWGDSTACFAAKVGETGQVHCFELNQEGLDVLSTQIDVSGANLKIFPNRLAVSDTDNEEIFVGEASPSTTIIENLKEGSSVYTTKIDTYASKVNLEKIDFIKMDIEGAEIPALIGASDSIAKFKPKLAISVYHKWDDLKEIPKLINSIRDDYEYYLDCTTGFGGEAVLYCK